MYKNNSAYTNPDYALEFWATGKVKKFIDNLRGSTYKRYSLYELEDYIKKNYRLPTIDESPMGIFARGDFTLEKIEELFTHTIEQEHKIDKLEKELSELRDKIKTWITTLADNKI